MVLRNLFCLAYFKYETKYIKHVFKFVSNFLFSLYSFPNQLMELRILLCVMRNINKSSIIRFKEYYITLVDQHLKSERFCGSP